MFAAETTMIRLSGSTLYGVNYESPPKLGFSIDNIAFSRKTLKSSSSSSTYSSSESRKIQRLNPLECCRGSTPPEAHETSQRDDDVAVHGLSEFVVRVSGGRHLGRMLCQAASNFGIKVMVLDPLGNCRARALSHYRMVGSFDDEGATVWEFAKRCGVLTVEIKHIDDGTLDELEQAGVRCKPRASTI